MGTAAEVSEAEVLRLMSKMMKMVMIVMPLTAFFVVLEFALKFHPLYLVIPVDIMAVFVWALTLLIGVLAGSYLKQSKDLTPTHTIVISFITTILAIAAFIH